MPNGFSIYEWFGKGSGKNLFLTHGSGGGIYDDDDDTFNLPNQTWIFSGSMKFLLVCEFD